MSTIYRINHSIEIHYDQSRVEGRYYAIVRVTEVKHRGIWDNTPNNVTTPFEIPLNGDGVSKARKKIASELSSRGINIETRLDDVPIKRVNHLR